MTSSARLATYFHIHLVSDSTGETLNAMARAVCARFNNVLPIEHIYALVRSERQLERALGEIGGAPGVVLHTIVDEALRTALERGCQGMDMPCFGVLDPMVSALSWYLGAPLSDRVGAQYSLDNDYFNRMDALSYALGHDDGQGGRDLKAADVILVGVSADLEDADLHLPRPSRGSRRQCSPGAGDGLAGWPAGAERNPDCRTHGKPRSSGPDSPQPSAQP